MCVPTYQPQAPDMWYVRRIKRVCFVVVSILLNKTKMHLLPEENFQDKDNFLIKTKIALGKWIITNMDIIQGIYFIDTQT